MTEYSFCFNLTYLDKTLLQDAPWSWGSRLGEEGRVLQFLFLASESLRYFLTVTIFFLNIKDTLYLYNVIYQLYLNKGEKKMAKEVLTVISHGTYNMFIIEADH